MAISIEKQYLITREKLAQYRTVTAELGKIIQSMLPYLDGNPEVYDGVEAAMIAVDEQIKRIEQIGEVNDHSSTPD